MWRREYRRDYVPPDTLVSAGWLVICGRLGRVGWVCFLAAE